MPNERDDALACDIADGVRWALPFADGVELQAEIASALTQAREEGAAAERERTSADIGRLWKVIQEASNQGSGSARRACEDESRAALASPDDREREP